MKKTVWIALVLCLVFVLGFSAPMCFASSDEILPGGNSSASSLSQVVTLENEEDFEEESNFGVALAAGVIAAFVISFIICQVFKGQMKTAVARTEASEYVTTGGIQFRERSDQYTHTTTTRRKIKDDSASKDD